MDHLSDDRQIKQYEKVGNSHISWWMSANKLLMSATLLKEKTLLSIKGFEAGEHPEKSDVNEGLMVLAPQLMIFGYAIECLMKGIWVKRGNQIVNDGKYQHIAGNDHDLVQLAQAIEFSLNCNEKDVLKRLSFYIKSGGRYPVPSKWVHNKIQGQDHDRVIGPLSHWRGNDYNITDSIIVRLTEELER